ncbi:MAG: hypothetical protein FWH14_00515 [Oscillospiraceae bacterium]|nr:hypothetical protein [Oscillospiraceae bacterium]
MTNLIANEAAYNGRLFPKIPDRVNGQDTLLISMEGVARKIDDYTTTKDIRKGNYNKVVRISTAPFSLDVKLKATSKNKPYEFDVMVGVEGRVKDSAAYYTNKAKYDIASSISTALSRIVTPIAKGYELTDDGVDSALYKEMSNRNFVLESLGITYTVHSADAEPDAKAEKFVKQMTDSTLTTRVQEHIAGEAEKLSSRNMESAIMRRVSSGEIDMQTALEQLSASNRKEGYNKLEDMERLIGFVRGLQEKNLITDDEAGQRINEFLRGLPSSLPNSGTPMNINPLQLEEKSASSDETLNELLPD